MNGIEKAGHKINKELELLEADRVQQLIAEGAYRDMINKKPTYYVPPVPPVQSIQVKKAANITKEKGKFSKHEVNKTLERIRRQFSKSL